MGFIKLFIAQTTGSSNTGIGHQAGEFINDANYTTLVGSQCGSYITNNDYNTMMGYYTGRNTTTGENNAFFGAIAGRFNSTGSRNTYIGCQAVDNQTHTGSDNTVVGFAAAQNITSGYENILIGKSVATSLSTGAGNIAIGISAGKMTTGGSNIAIGYSAMGGNSVTGSNNTVLGDASGYEITSGTNNLLLGKDAGRNSSPSGTLNSHSNRICLGDNGITNAYIRVSWTVTSDARDKGEIKKVPHGLDFIDKLNPVSFEFKTKRDSEETDGNERYGFLAQDILKLEGDNPVIIDNEHEENLKLKESNLIPVLVNAIKELKAEIELLKNK